MLRIADQSSFLNNWKGAEKLLRVYRSELSSGAQVRNRNLKVGWRHAHPLPRLSKKVQPRWLRLALPLPNGLGQGGYHLGEVSYFQDERQRDRWFRGCGKGSLKLPAFERYRHGPGVR